MLGRTFSSLKYRNYRLFFFGQLISLTGTWMQWTAQQWLVYKLTNSEALLGIILACGTLPILLFSMIGGMTADRVAKRKILIYTQSVMMISALVMGFLAIFDLIEVWHIGVLAVLSGFSAAFDMPSRQAFVIEMVGREDLMNAIGLNSSIFNAARIVGPAVAGIMMAEFNIGICFILNGISFVAVIVGLCLMRFDIEVESKERKSMWKEIREGLVYVQKKKEIFWLFITISIVGVFGFSYATLIPAFARDILNVTEKGYGLMVAVGGIGALFAALSVATLGKTSDSRMIIVFGLVIFSIFAGIFSFSHSYILSVVMLTLAAYGIISFFTTANTFVQMAVSDDMRGRVMGVWTFVFGGTLPLGYLQVGFLGEHLGPNVAVFIGSAICFCTIIFLGIYLFKRKTI